MLKKTAALCCAASMLLFTACGNKSTESEVTEKVYEDITTADVTEKLPDETSAKKTTVTTTAAEKTQTEKAETTVKTEAVTETATEAVTAAAVKSAEVKEGDFVYKKPDDAFIRKCLEEADGGTVYIAMYADGRCEKVTEDAIYAIETAAYFEEMFSEESYNELTDEMKEMLGVTTYEEYKSYLQEALDIYEVSSQTVPAVYFCLNGKVWYDRDEFEESDVPENIELAMRAADFFFNKPVENKEIVKAMSDALKEGGNYFASCSAEYMGNNILRCDAGFGSDHDSYEADFDYDERISVDGSQGFVLGDSFVPLDTETLFISSRDIFTAEMLAGDFIPDDCVKAASPETYYGDEETVFDIALIAEKLPKLKKLYMYQAVLENADKLSELKNLESLSYYRIHPTDETDGWIESMNDAPFTEMKNLKELRLYADYDSYEFLADMPNLEDVFINASKPSADKLEQIFSCPYITGLELKGVTSLKGIEKLEKLTYIDIDSDDIDDFSPLGKLKNLEKADIMSRGSVKGLESLTKLKKLKDLTLHSMDNTDLSFVGELASVEKLSLCYVNSSFDSSLGKLKKLKYLSLTDITRSYDTEFIGELENLTDLFIFGDYADLNSIPKLKKLETVSLMLCSFFDLSALKECESLKALTIYNCESRFRAEWIENSQLEYLSLSCAEMNDADKLKTLKKLKNITTFMSLSNEEIEMLKEALPDCVIEEVQ